MDPTDRQDQTNGKNTPCKTRIKLKINGPKESQAPKSSPKHEDVDEDILMGNAFDSPCETQQGLANLSNKLAANTPNSSRRRRLKIKGPKEKGVSTSYPKNECSEKNTPDSGRRIKLKINGPSEMRLSMSAPEHKIAGEHTPKDNAPGLPCAAVQQKSANISSEVVTDTPRSSRKRRRACLPGSPMISPRRDSAFSDSSTCKETSKRCKTLDVSLVSPTKQLSSDSSRNSLIPTVRVSHAAGRGNSASTSQPSAKKTSVDAGCSNPSGRVEHQSGFKQPAEVQIRRLGKDSDSENEDDKNRNKKPLKSCHDDSDVSSDDSKRRKGCGSNKAGKLAKEQGNPVSWLLGVPSPFAANEIDDATAQVRTRPPVFVYSFGTSSQNVVSSDDASDADSNAACGLISVSASNIPSTDPSQIKGKWPDRSNAKDLQNSDRLERPRRQSFVDSFLNQDRHPREGTKFPNMAIQGYARACGMPTSAQFAGQRYKIADCEGNKVVMNPIPIAPKISERSNLIPRDVSFPGPSRKELLKNISQTCDGVDSSCTGESPEHYNADRESSPSRGRIGSPGPPNVSREESEGRPGWRNTVLVPAHVITGEETRHAPWVVDARPHELERDGMDREAGYKASSLPTDDTDQEEGYTSSSLPTDRSSDNDSITVEGDVSLGHETEERADASSLVHGTEQTARAVLVQRTEQTAKIVLVPAAEPNRSALQIREDAEPTSDSEDLVNGSSSRQNPPQISKIDGENATSSGNTAEIPIRMKSVPSSRITHGGTGYPVEHASSVPTSEGFPAISMAYPQGVTGPRPRLSISSNESSAGCDCCINEVFKCIMCGLPQRQSQTPQNPYHPPPRSAATKPLPSNIPRSRCQTVLQEADWRNDSTGTATANATPQNRTNEASVETLELQEVEASTVGQPGNSPSSNAQKDVSSSRQASLHHAGSR